MVCVFSENYVAKTREPFSTQFLMNLNQVQMAARYLTVSCTYMVQMDKTVEQTVSK